MVSLNSILLLLQIQSPTPDYLIVAEQTSGYTRMEDAFQNLCVLKTDGTLQGLLQSHRTQQGWARITPFRETLTPEEKTRVVDLLRSAEKGPFIEEPGACDTGTLVIQGHLNPNPPFPVSLMRDCATSVHNQSEAANSLEKWVFDHCKFIPPSSE